MPRILVCCLIVTAIVSPVSSQSNGDGDSVYKVTIDEPILLVSKLHFLVGKIDCPPLPAGKTCLIHVTLASPQEEILDVDRGETDCGCAEVKLIPTKGTAALEIKITTPANRASESFSTGMYFRAITNRGPASINIGFSCRLTGLLSFATHIQKLTLHSTINVSSFELPLVATLDNPDFRIEFDGGVAFEEIRISEDCTKLIVTISPDLVSDADVFGRLTLRDRNSGQSASINLLIQREKQLVVSPHAIRFYKSVDDGGYKATAFVRLGETMAESSAAVLAEARVLDRTVKVTSSRLSARVVKLHLFLADEVLNAEGESSVAERTVHTLEWRIEAGAECFSQIVPVFFAD